MTDGEKIVWGAAATLVVGGIIAFVKLLRTWGDDRVDLKADLWVASDVEFIDRIGCAGLLLSIVCRSKRPAKINEAFISVRGFNPMAAMQAGFQDNFGYTPSPAGHEHDDSFLVYFVPFSKPTSAEGYVLERDDVCKFALPIQVPALPKFIEAQPADVRIVVTFFDGTEREVMWGEQVQSEIKSLIDMWGNAAQCLKVRLRFAVRVLSSTLPTPGPVGKVNPQPIQMWEPKDPEKS
jgi:hypothetical protein